LNVIVKSIIDLIKKCSRSHPGIADFKANIARLSSDNKLAYFDKTDPVSIIKGKRFVNENFAGFVISSDSKACTALYSNGKIIHFPLKNSKIEKKESIRPVDGFSEFFELKQEILNSYKSGNMDGMFIEILRATNFWGVDTPEKDYSFE
uniref:hypothetical protein n=1 Tax=Vibrio salilacus TaxID=1323749 RepID=UPI0012FDB6DC